MIERERTVRRGSREKERWRRDRGGKKGRREKGEGKRDGRKKENIVGEEERDWVMEDGRQWKQEIRSNDRGKRS